MMAFRGNNHLSVLIAGTFGGASGSAIVPRAIVIRIRVPAQTARRINLLSHAPTPDLAAALHAACNTQEPVHLL